MLVLTDMWTGEQQVLDVRADPLMQGEVWVTAGRELVAIEDMSARHIGRVILRLRRRAGRLHRRAVSRMEDMIAGPLGPRGDMAVDACEYELRLLESTPAAEWLEGVPLMRALKAELVRRYEPWGVGE